LHQRDKKRGWLGPEGNARAKETQRRKCDESRAETCASRYLASHQNNAAGVSSMYTITWESTRQDGPAKGCTGDHKVRNVDPAVAADFIRGTLAHNATARNFTVYQAADGAVVPLSSVLV
jgi:hypothetical protein